MPHFLQRIEPVIARLRNSLFFIQNSSLRDFLIACCCALILSGCQTPEHPDEYGYDIQPEPKPSDEPPSRYGNQESYTVNGMTFQVRPTSEGYREVGVASWYGKQFHGRPTSTMEPFDMFSISAAHPTLPIPTYVRVTNLENNSSMIVRVNDRGPFHANRIIDLSYGAAVRLGFANQGTAQVEVEAVAPYQVRWEGAGNTAYSQTNTHRGATYQSAYDPNSNNQRFVYLQAGAYLDSASAQKALSRLQQWLQSRGMQEPVHLVFNDGYQKLHVGPLRNFSQAEALRQQLSASPWGKPIWIEVNPNR